MSKLPLTTHHPPPTNHHPPPTTHSVPLDRHKSPLLHHGTWYFVLGTTPPVPPNSLD